MESFSPKVRNKRQRCPLSPLLFNIVLKSHSHSNQTTKRNNGNEINKEEVKFSLFADDIILYIENLKDSNETLLELIHKFSKVVGYKINVQKFIAFLYTNNETAEREIKELIPFTIAPKTIR